MLEKERGWEEEIEEMKTNKRQTRKVRNTEQKNQDHKKMMILIMSLG